MSVIKSVILLVLGGVITLLSYTLLRPDTTKDLIISPSSTPAPTPLLKYSLPSLQNYSPKASLINLESLIASTKDQNIYSGSFLTASNKKMTLQIMVPNSSTPSAGFPTIIMLRGFVDQEIYQSGMGTKNMAKFLSKNHFVTIAPDFLGYAGSEKPPEDTFEARFEKVAQILDLIESKNSLTFVNPSQTYLWGHSNGGQIGLSVLAVSPKSLPSVFWAPVTKPFPYSILFYSDELKDYGKSLRKSLAQFESIYDVDDFSLHKTMNHIQSPVLLIQGGRDIEVPLEWSREFVTNLKQYNQDVDLVVYNDADHNLQPSWSSAAVDTLRFYQKQENGTLP